MSKTKVRYQVRKGEKTLFEHSRAKNCWTWCVQKHNDPMSDLSFKDLKVYAKIGTERVEIYLWPTDEQKEKVAKALDKLKQQEV